MKKRILNIILASLLVISLVGCSAAQGNENMESDTEEVTLVLDWTPNTNHTGIYVAEAKGYFEEAGIKVNIVQPPEGGAELLVASGKAQFGISAQDTMMPALIGEDALPIEAIATIIQHNTSGIISRAGEGIERPKGMEEKKYATWDLDLEKATIREVVETDGGDYESIEMIPSTVTDEVSALRSKSVDAIWVFYGWAGIAAEVEDLETDYFAFKDIKEELDFYTPVIFGNSDWMKNNSEITKTFLSAVKKGYEYAIDHAEEGAEILCEAAPELDAELVKESQEYLSKEYQSDAQSWGYIDPQRWNCFYNWVNEKGILGEEIPENTGFTNEYLEN